MSKPTWSEPTTSKPLTSIPIIQRRRIEAELIRELHGVLTERHGRQHADEVIAESVRRSAIAEARQFAAQADGATSLETFADLQQLWTAGEALTIEVERRDADGFDFNVTRCRYAEMYRDMGLGDIGHLLSCARDGAFCEGYDPALQLTRTQTLMQGASHCDFRYRYDRRRDPGSDSR